MRRTGLLLSSALVAVIGLCGTAAAQERAVIIKGFGAKSGVVRSFGINSEAAMRAAADAINSQGGVKLGDGTIGKIDVEFLDDRCTAEEGISVVRRIAAGPALVAIGPGCSNVAEPLFGVLQRKAGDASDSGLQFPIFTDVAIKGGLAKISEWAFRNVPSEIDMYNALFTWLKTKNPELKTIFAGVEENFAHSRASWYAVMKEAAPKVGLEVKGEAKWLLEDTNFAQQVREIKAASPDILAIAAHPFTTCGVLKEMRRQGVKVKLLVGLTSSSSMETLQGCAREAEGIVIPTSFAPVTKEAEAAAAQAAKFNGSLDLHSAAAYENIFILKKVIEEQGVLAKPDTVQADREKIRKGLAALKETDGLLGKSKRTEDREAVKPYMYVHAKDGKWAVLFNPLTN
ncbi:amino acid ABC transporter substrate-binding protein [Vineibacter terrae]|uniref:Amino acid ABC transporter substrate-binding protein n=1 Tax=Vineibacter terrae TaxID=2586908 RepID=A0A5C8P8C0_9HYPH|nr:ABC transporter substrate-binding protein [Vineibacter terrae]TXL69994.1 amino acid ABC transporter substrate-binding protein [Vineibacter terrae]